MPKTKTTFGIIVGTRGFFNPKLAAEGRKEILAVLDKLGFEAVILPADQTPNGAVETLQDARKYADLFQERRKDIDGIVVILPNFGDELGVVQTIDLAKLGVPVLVQACSDDLVHVDVAGRRDAFCGKLSSATTSTSTAFRLRTPPPTPATSTPKRSPRTLNTSPASAARFGDLQAPASG